LLQHVQTLVYSKQAAFDVTVQTLVAPVPALIMWPALTITPSRIQWYYHVPIGGRGKKGEGEE